MFGEEERVYHRMPNITEPDGNCNLTMFFIRSGLYHTLLPTPPPPLLLPVRYKHKHNTLTRLMLSTFPCLFEAKSHWVQGDQRIPLNYVIVNTWITTSDSQWFVILIFEQRVSGMFLDKVQAFLITTSLQSGPGLRTHKEDQPLVLKNTH